jgi:hypothetical protein
MITAEQLRGLVDYDPNTGVFVWKHRIELDRHVRAWNTRYAGNITGSVNNVGYVQVNIGNHNYKAHRLAWLHVHGEWPKSQIDHINRVRTDNRIENLRLATPTENLWNSGVRLDNKSGAKGIDWHKGARKWRARITINDGTRINLGLFEVLSEASAAYDAYAIAHQGAFANPNGDVHTA